MLHAALDVDLPARTPDPSDAVRRHVARIIGDPEEPDERRERRLLAALTVFEALLGAPGDAGFDDVLAIVIDGKPAYRDVESNADDLAVAVDASVASGTLDRGFSVLRTTQTQVRDGLRILAELRCHIPAPAGQPAVRLRISARLLDLDPAPDETPRAWAERIRRYIRDPEAIEGHRAVVDEVTTAVGDALKQRLPGTTVHRHAPELRVVALGPRQVGRLRHLGFADRRRPGPWPGLPAHERIGAYAGPLHVHHASVYRDLFDWIALGEILAGHWSRPDLRVVTPSGATLARGEAAAHLDPTRLEVPRDAVRVSPRGRLVIDASIPHVPDVVAIVRGGPHSPGWAGEEWTEDLG